ncbi:MAG TPA: DUF748 domain-containing protein [Steroidobacteraceae bacterium]|nr:DUF748 domain-containing protein [Steroidobacteraceae bacterium]
MVQARIRRLLLWVALPALVLVLLYTVLGFFLVPHLVRSGVHDFVSKNYHREVTLGDVRFNPYTLRLDVRDFSLPDSDGKPMLAFRHLLVDVTVASLWRLGPDFEAILLEQPFARVVIEPDGTLNFSELALPPSPDAKPEPPNPKPARLFIKNFSVQGGNVAFEDLAHPSPFRTEIKPITFELRNFATVGKEGGTYALSGASDAGERFSWAGSLKTYPLASHGQFEVGNLQAQTIWKYLRDSVQFELPSGVISIAGEYDFTAATSPVGLGVNVHDVTITDLGVRPKGATEDYVKLARLEVHETRADVAKRTVDVGSVRLAGGEVRAWVPGAGGAAVNLMELVGAAPAASAGAPAATAGDAAASAASTAASGSAGAEAGGASATASANAATSAPAGDPAAAAATSAPTTDAPAWTVSVPDIALDNLKISAEDRQISPAVPVQLDDLSVHVTGFTTSHSTPVAVVMSTKINRTGKLDAKADLTPDLAGMKVEADLANLDLTVLQPYIAQRTAMTLRNGLLSTKLNVERAADGHLAVAGEVDVAKLRTVDNELKRDFIKFEDLKLTGIDYQATPSTPAKPASLHIKNITARAPYARVIIESDRSVNVGRVLSGPNGAKEPPSATNTKTAGKPDAAGASVADAVANVSSGTTDSPDAHAAISIGSQPAPAGGDTSAAATAPTSGNTSTAGGSAAGAASASAAASPSATGASGTGAGSGHTSGPAAAGTAPASAASTGRGHSKRHGGKSTPAAAPAATPAAGDTMAIAVDAINIQDGSANYADLWIQPHFAVGIQSLNGSILGLSSNPRSRAKVELKGKVDRYAPVHIWGETNPLAATTYSDIKMNFKGVELTSATPYSGHFAGYKIEKGKLSVDIDYKIENRKLTAAHKFVIDQLELGERVESPDAVHLPLKIAVALLKDRNGVIDIDLPVTGSLDDPQFKIGPLIWKAVLNLLTKIATAPFAMLGHLFGGGEQMNYIDFHPGSAVLDPSEHDKLVALVKALKEKEKLELDVPVTYSPDLDRPGLAAAHLDARLLELSQDKAGGHKRGKSDAKSNSASGSAAQKTAAASPSAQPADAAARTDSSPPPAGASDSARSPASAVMDAPPPSDPALTDPAQRYHLLVALYRADLGKSTPLPPLSLAIEGAGKKKDQPPPDFGAANAELETALLQKAPVADNELEVLGKHRARAIQDVLLIGTDIDPSRVFVIGNAPKGPAEKDKVRVELALK